MSNETNGRRVRRVIRHGGSHIVDPPTKPTPKPADKPQKKDLENAD